MITDDDKIPYVLTKEKLERMKLYFESPLPWPDFNEKLYKELDLIHLENTKEKNEISND